MNALRPLPRLTGVPSRSAEVEPVHRLNWLDKAMVQHAHPSKLILDTVAYMWGLYLFSAHQLAAGLIVLFGVGGLGTVLTMSKDKDALARTPIGRFFLVGAHPANMILQVIGYTVTAYGSWIHSTAVILSGVTLVLLGHLFGWDRFAD